MNNQYEPSIRRMAWLVIFAAVFTLTIMCRLFFISLSLGPELIASARQKVIQEREVTASRGNIYSNDGQLLATSMPVYELRWDAAIVDPQKFNSQITKTSIALSGLLPRSPSNKSWEKYLRKTFSRKNRYALLAKDLSYSDYRQVSQMPLFKGNKYKTGLITLENHTRLIPLGLLAERTIGYDRASRVGLESSFNETLKGHNGKRWMQNLGGNQWKPIDSEFSNQPVNGQDIVTTINSRIQDIAHKALIQQLKKYDADHGCAVVMDVATGKIRAISNLGKTKTNSNYRELRNYAVWEKSEPGSTFKVASLLVALEDGKVDTAQKIDTRGGEYVIYGKKVRDSKPGGYGIISIGRALELSSNTGIVKAIYSKYLKRPEDFIDRMYQIGLADMTEIRIPGESAPYIPHPDDKGWNGLTLPWMIFGYGIESTPLQILTFYNAIANNGRMVRPTLWEGTRDHGVMVENNQTQVMHPSIASERNILQIQDLLEKAVRRGTARNIYTDSLNMAGKTGTCQIDYWDPETLGYQASFAGYFPAKSPKYSCIVVINRPEISAGYYANIVAAPVFRDIALAVHKMTPQTEIPPKGYWGDAIDHMTKNNEKRRISNYNIAVQKLELGETPDIKGWKVSDAIKLYEENGWQITLQGNGTVLSYDSEFENKKIHIRLG